MREPRYLAIAAELRRRVEAGEPAPGRLLSSEAGLSEEFGASRVTVRKALESLRAEGLIEAHQGLGWLVSGGPLRQTLGRLGTIEAQLAAEGVRPQRRVLHFAVGRPPPEVAAVLGPGPVLCVRRLNLADGQPFARVTVWAAAAEAAGLSREDLERSTFYDLLGDRLGGATQTIAAARAEPDDAVLLGIPPGSPVLRCRRVTRDRAGAPLLVAEHVFPARRTEFVVELGTAEPSMGPSGLRLVE